MKKILALLLLASVFCLSAHAATISYDQFTASTTIAEVNEAVNQIYDDYNGNISGTYNILADSLIEANMADAINPRVRDFEFLGNFTYTGHLPATSASTLTSNISAGTSYVNGYRCNTSATSKTYTASVDTWVYIDQNSTFQYVETAVGGAQPTTPANSLLLAKVTTDTDNITTVTDLRTTTIPGLRVYNNYLTGARLSRDATETTLSVSPGACEFGLDVTSGHRKNTTVTSIACASVGRGGLDAGSLAAGYYYVFLVADDGNEANFEGIASLSSTDATGVTGERLVGWFYATSTTVISLDAVGAYRGDNSARPNVYQAQKSELAIPVGANSMSELHCAKYYSSGGPLRITYSASGKQGGTGSITTSISLDTIAAFPNSMAHSYGDTRQAGSATGTFELIPGIGEHDIN